MIFGAHTPVRLSWQERKTTGTMTGRQNGGNTPATVP